MLRFEKGDRQPHSSFYTRKEKVFSQKIHIIDFLFHVTLSQIWSHGRFWRPVTRSHAIMTGLAGHSLLLRTGVETYCHLGTLKFCCQRGSRLDRVDTWGGGAVDKAAHRGGFLELQRDPQDLLSL